MFTTCSHLLLLLRRDVLLTRRDVIRAQERRVPAKGHLHFEFEISDDARVSEVDMFNDVHVFRREEGVAELCTVLVLVSPVR